MQIIRLWSANLMSFKVTKKCEKNIFQVETWLDECFELKIHFTVCMKRKHNSFTWRCIKTTDPSNLHVPPWRSTWSIRNICKNLMPRIALVAKTWPLLPSVSTTIEAITTIRSKEIFEKQFLINLVNDNNWEYRADEKHTDFHWEKWNFTFFFKKSFS